MIPPPPPPNSIYINFSADKWLLRFSQTQNKNIFLLKFIGLDLTLHEAKVNHLKLNKQQLNQEENLIKRINDN